MCKGAVFPLRRAVERLRAGLFDPLAVDRLTIEEEEVVKSFSQGLQELDRGTARPLLICGAYGQGKSHSLLYLRSQALSQGYAVSWVQLDPREVPFRQFSTVYRSLMHNLSLPGGESFAAVWKRSLLEIPEEMPHRFRMLLRAIAAEDGLPSQKKRGLSGLKRKEFDALLESALFGRDLPIAYLKEILRVRQVEGYKEEPLACRGNAPYVQMIHALGALLRALGFKGLVLFFDEAESIVQGSLARRAKGYEILDQLFCHRGATYPIFAFTEIFFDIVRSEKYAAECARLPKNYAEAWRDLPVVRLRDASPARWEALQDRLIALYKEAYQVEFSAETESIKREMHALLEKVKMQETRYKLKALIHHLDIVSTRATP